MYGENHPNPGHAYADTVKDLIDEVHKKGRKVNFPTAACNLNKISDMRSILKVQVGKIMLL